jgi:hypothetical protein
MFTKYYKDNHKKADQWLKKNAPLYVIEYIGELKSKIDLAVQEHNKIASVINNSCLEDSSESYITFEYIAKEKRIDISELRSGFPNLMNYLPGIRKIAKKRS